MKILHSNLLATCTTSCIPVSPIIAAESHKCEERTFMRGNAALLINK